MSVDTKRLRLRADRAQQGTLIDAAGLAEEVRSAADELDELMDLRGAIVRVVREHETTKRKLAAMTELRDKAVEEGLRINRQAFGELSDVIDPLKHENRELKARLQAAETALRRLEDAGQWGVSEAGCAWCCGNDNLSTADLVAHKHVSGCPIGDYFAHYGERKEGGHG